MATGEGLGTSAAYALDPERTPHTYLELGALPTAVPCARLHVKHVLREWQMAQLADPVELIVAELVTNAMQASAGLTGSQFAGRWSPGLPPVRLWLASDGHHAVIQVWDASEQQPVHEAVPLDATSEAQRPHGIGDPPAARRDVGVRPHAIAPHDGLVVGNQPGDGLLQHSQIREHQRTLA